MVDNSLERDVRMEQMFKEEMLWGWTTGPWAKERRWLAEAGKVKDRDIFLATPEGTNSAGPLSFAPLDWFQTSDLPSENKCGVFKPQKFVLICYSSNRKQVW